MKSSSFLAFPLFQKQSLSQCPTLSTPSELRNMMVYSQESIQEHPWTAHFLSSACPRWKQASARRIHSHLSVPSCWEPVPIPGNKKITLKCNNPYIRITRQVLVSKRWCHPLSLSNSWNPVPSLPFLQVVSHLDGPHDYCSFSFLLYPRPQTSQVSLISSPSNTWCNSTSWSALLFSKVSTNSQEHSELNFLEPELLPAHCEHTQIPIIPD